MGISERHRAVIRSTSSDLRSGTFSYHPAAGIREETKDLERVAPLQDELGAGMFTRKDCGQETDTEATNFNTEKKKFLKLKIYLTR